jgi:ABC-type Zn uptake system ZnuABC Zn-binding protein ZnuA
VQQKIDQAKKDIESADVAIGTAQAQFVNNEAISSEELFQILARDDMETVILALNLEGMRSLVGLLMEHLSNAHQIRDGDLQKIENLIESNTLWASLKTHMLTEATNASGYSSRGERK